MANTLIHIFGAMYDIISLQYDIVDNSNYIDERLVHEWDTWRIWMEYADTILRKTDWKYVDLLFQHVYGEPCIRFQPFPIDFPGEFVVEGGDIDEEAS